MSGRNAARLAGWIRFVPDGDGYGLPLFSPYGDRGGNFLCTPRTDELLRITNFDPFYNGDGYSVSYDLPQSAANRIYSPNDPVPIPFVLEGQPDIIHGDISSANLNERFAGYPEASVGGLIREMIVDARRSAVRGVFINRASETERLFELWERVKQNPGKACFVVLMGDAGVGKTALLHHFASKIREGFFRAPEVFSITTEEIGSTDLSTLEWSRRLRRLNQPVILHIDGGQSRGVPWMSGNIVPSLKDVWALVVFEIREKSPSRIPSTILGSSVYAMSLGPLNEADIRAFLEYLRIGADVGPEALDSIAKYTPLVTSKPGNVKNLMEAFLMQQRT